MPAVNASRVYLDYAATAPFDTRLYEALQNASWANANALYTEGREAATQLRDARARIAVRSERMRPPRSSSLRVVPRLITWPSRGLQNLLQELRIRTSLSRQSSIMRCLTQPMRSNPLATRLTGSCQTPMAS